MTSVLAPGIVVMSHRDRAHRAHQLAADLSPALMSYDPNPDGPPSAHRSMRQALREATDCFDQADHLIVIQDDATPIQRFPTIAAKVLARPENADRLVAFYVGTLHACARTYQHAHRAGMRYVDLPISHYVPTLCLAWPQAAARRFLRDTQARGHILRMPWDDEAVKEWRKRSGYPAVATIPCLVGHDNTERSLMRHQHHGARYPLLPYSHYPGDLGSGW